QLRRGLRVGGQGDLELDGRHRVEVELAVGRVHVVVREVPVPVVVEPGRVPREGEGAPLEADAEERVHRVEVEPEPEGGGDGDPWLKREGGRDRITARRGRALAAVAALPEAGDGGAREEGDVGVDEEAREERDLAA